MPSATACFTSSATSFIFPFCNFSEMSCKIALIVCSLKVVLIQAMPAACNAARTAPAVPCIQMIMRGTGASRLSIVSKPLPGIRDESGRRRRPGYTLDPQHVSVGGQGVEQRLGVGPDSFQCEAVGPRLRGIESDREQAKRPFGQGGKIRVSVMAFHYGEVGFLRADIGAGCVPFLPQS